ncbi:MAG TPA: protease pro-enzyme activation domain-containing protein [Bryobacteraceae bacterium]
MNLLAQPSRIARRAADNERVSLIGHIHPKARPEFDRGRVSPSLTLTHLTLEISPSAAQKADLEQLLIQQGTPGSPNYHRWLTPEEYAQRFGASDADIAEIGAWLQSHGLTVTSVARGHNWIAFDGAAAQVESAFGTELNRYLVSGELHFANATQPSIPAAFSGIVTAVRGLHDFRARPFAHRLAPNYTSARTGSHYVVPDDLATIYDIAPLYGAGLSGAGQTLAVVGQSQIVLSNVQQFRSAYGLPANDPQTLLVPGSRDPGVVTDDVDEAHLDVEWSGAVARGAHVLFVYAADVMQAAQYAIDQRLAPVLSISYGSCEPETFSADAMAMRNWARQANAEGITWFAASGDNGAADCNDAEDPGAAVDLPASIPEVTGVGGTEFQEGSGQYWNTTNSATGASALSYIPEIAWNDSAAAGSPDGTGGGASVLFPKPSWQTGPGVPGDNARHVPDIALNASNEHDSYLVYSGGALQGFGGTSFGSPIFAGVAALLNQYLSSPGLGNVNPNLYSLAQTAPSAFHDITAGNNIVTVACPPRSRAGCSATPVGYTAGVGYDQATGLGSVDVAKFFSAWNGAGAPGPPSSDVSVTLVTSKASVAATDVVDLIASVVGLNGATPTGSVEFTAGNIVLGSVALVGSAGAATATLVVNGSQLVSGAVVTASYSGSSASVSIGVSSSGQGANAAPSLSAVTNAASYKQSYAPGELVTLWGAQLAQTTQLDSAIPLPLTMSGLAATVNGVAAPLLYVSSGQVNLQIPYETPVGAGATVTLNNNGRVSSQSIAITASAPGIFMDSSGTVANHPSAKAQDVIDIYVTGAGAVSPGIATGAAPSPPTPLASLPVPAQNTTVTVGNVTAPIQFIGIPPGLVGVVQINILVPSGLPLGAQPVVVTVGGVASAPALLSIAN